MLKFNWKMMIVYTVICICVGMLIMWGLGQKRVITQYQFQVTDTTIALYEYDTLYDTLTYIDSTTLFYDIPIETLIVKTHLPYVIANQKDSIPIEIYTEFRGLIYRQKLKTYTTQVDIEIKKPVMIPYLNLGVLFSPATNHIGIEVETGLKFKKFSVFFRVNQNEDRKYLIGTKLWL